MNQAGIITTIMMDQLADLETRTRLTAKVVQGKGTDNERDLTHIDGAHFQLRSTNLKTAHFLHLWVTGQHQDRRDQLPYQMVLTRGDLEQLAELCNGVTEMLDHPLDQVNNKVDLLKAHRLLPNVAPGYGMGKQSLEDDLNGLKLVYDGHYFLDVGKVGHYANFHAFLPGWHSYRALDYDFAHEDPYSPGLEMCITNVMRPNEPHPDPAQRVTIKCQIDEGFDRCTDLVEHSNLEFRVTGHVMEGARMIHGYIMHHLLGYPVGRANEALNSPRILRRVDLEVLLTTCKEVLTELDQKEPDYWKVHRLLPNRVRNPHEPIDLTHGPADHLTVQENPTAIYGPRYIEVVNRAIGTITQAIELPGEIQYIAQPMPDDFCQ